MQPHAEIILHHYASSPYCEKVRLALGLKGLRWRSVETPNRPPRPRLDPLTGGYRRLPVLQIGADIYCDTHAILPALERLSPEPSLYPGLAPGLADALAFGFERDVWLAAIGVRTQFAEDPPEAFLRDRQEDYLYIDMSRAAMAPDYPRNRQRVAAHVGRLVDALADGRAFLTGERAGAVDLGYFHALWLMREGAQAGTVDEALALEPILGWYARVAALGHGTPEPMSAEAALAVATDAEPAPIAVAIAPEPDGLQAGETVSVTPDDFARKPVHGSLVALERTRVVIRHAQGPAGRLNLHFPRAGFTVARA